VLQREPEHAAVTGSVPEGYGSDMMVRVTLTDASAGFQHSVDAAIRDDRTWKVLLPPRPAFGDYAISALCAKGCSGDNATKTASVEDVTFGDVFVCSGQSNVG
jgi:hypothetical protein